MLEKEQNIRNLRVQLDEWHKEIDKLKCKLSDADTKTRSTERSMKLKNGLKMAKPN